MSGKRKAWDNADQEPRKPKYYVKDGATTHEISRASYPCVILYDDVNGASRTIGTLEKVQHVLQPRVTIKTSDHISALVLRVVIEYEDSHGDPTTYACMIRLSAHAVGTMALQVLEDADLAPLGLRQYKHEGDIFYNLTVSGIVSSLICAERLFCDSPDAQHFLEVANLFRAITDLRLVIKGSEQTLLDVEALENMFVSERDEDKILAWHKNHENKVMAQLGMFLEKNERPNPRFFERKTSMFTWAEYMTVLPFSLIQEEEAKEAALAELVDGTLDLRVMTLPKSADRRYLGFLFLLPGTSIRLSSGDRLKLNFDPESDIREEDWSAIIVDPVSWAPLNTVSLLLTRPFDKDEHGRGTWREETKFDPAKFNDMRDDQQARQLLVQTPCVKVAVKPITSNLVFRNCLTAIQRIDLEGTATLKRWLLGSRMDEFATIDFYANLRAKFGDVLEEQLLNLHGSQLIAAHGLKALRYGKQFVQGPPGTGKTYYAKEIVKPFLMDNTQVHQGIMCSVTNEGVDELALGMQDLAGKVTPQGQIKPMIIRFHSLTTEEDVGLLDAKKARGKPDNARPSLVDDELDVDTLNECVFQQNLFEHILSVTTVTEPLINDPRLKQLQLSLGIRMLQVAGMPGFECEYSEPAKFAVPREFYRQYKANQNLSSDDMKEFRKSMKELRAYTLSAAKETVQVTIIVCTVANIASPVLYRNAQETEFFLLDEIPRVVEPELWAMFAHYPDTSCHVLIGDPSQLPPQLESSWRDNCFSTQLEQSLFSRFYYGGHIHYFFDQQHRAVDVLGNFVSAVFYDTKLTNGPSTGMDHESRDIARRVKEYNKATYTKSSPLIFLDNKDAVAKQNDVGKSTFNISNCSVGMNLAVDLVQKKFDPSKITLLTPYNAQRRYYQAAVEKADTMHPGLGLRKIKVAVVDGYQGKENHVVILDWTVVEKLGFLKEFGRICVAHSRAKDALYIIGNKDELEKNQQSDTRVFKRLLGRSGVGSLKISLKGTQTSPYVSEDMVDLSMEFNYGAADPVEFTDKAPDPIKEEEDLVAGGTSAVATGQGGWPAGAVVPAVSTSVDDEPWNPNTAGNPDFVQGDTGGSNQGAADQELDAAALGAMDSGDNQDGQKDDDQDAKMGDDQDAKMDDVQDAKMGDDQDGEQRAGQGGDDAMEIGS